MASGVTLPGPPAPSGRIYNKTPIKDIGQAVPKPYLRNRLKADDSAAVCMSDQKLGKSISSR